MTMTTTMRIIFMPLGSQKVLEHVVIMSSIFVVREQASKQSPFLLLPYSCITPIAAWAARLPAAMATKSSVSLPDLAELAKTMQQAASPITTFPPFYLIEYQAAHRCPESPEFEHMLLLLSGRG